VRGAWCTVRGARSDERGARSDEHLAVRAEQRARFLARIVQQIMYFVLKDELQIDNWI
jgi:hypothetical protein